jgi:hypothetical protein
MFSNTVPTATETWKQQIRLQINNKDNIRLLYSNYCTVYDLYGNNYEQQLHYYYIEAVRCSKEYREKLLTENFKK